MAIFHLHMQPIERSKARSSTAAAAYRSGTCIIDERTGEVHDYRKKRGVVSSDLILPEGVPDIPKAQFWSRVEKHHKRGDAVVAREFDAALPHELSDSERRRLAVDFGREMSEHYKVGVEVDLHRPVKRGDLNDHGHFLLSACAVYADGFGKKVVELDPIHCQRHQMPAPAEYWRKRWAELTNERLAENGIDARIDHRTLEAQGIDRVPGVHLGPAATGFEKRTGEESNIRRREREKTERAELEAELEEIDLDTEIGFAAKAAFSAHGNSELAQRELFDAQAEVRAEAARVARSIDSVKSLPTITLRELPGLAFTPDEKPPDATRPAVDQVEDDSDDEGEGEAPR